MLSLQSALAVAWLLAKPVITALIVALPSCTISTMLSHP
jgi:hypothetical protein